MSTKWINIMSSIITDVACHIRIQNNINPFKVLASILRLHTLPYRFLQNKLFLKKRKWIMYKSIPKPTLQAITAAGTPTPAVTRNFKIWLSKILLIEILDSIKGNWQIFSFHNYIVRLQISNNGQLPLTTKKELSFFFFFEKTPIKIQTTIGDL